MKKRNGYKIGVAKRALKAGRDDFEPGGLIARMNAQKVATPMQEMPKNSVERTAIMGAV